MPAHPRRFRRSVVLPLVVALALAACQSPANAPGGTGARRPAGPRPGASQAATDPGTTGPGGVGPAAGSPATTDTPGGGALPATGTSAPPGTTAPPGLAAVALTGVVRAPARVVSNNGGGLLANNGAGFISDQGGGLISDRGGSLISDQGGGLISDKGASYRLAAAADVPLANTQVGLFDAAGRVVRDAAGRPLVTTTDAQGRYALPAAPTGECLVLLAAVGNGAGLASAIVTPGAGARGVDVDFASTVVTTYILQQYVKPQADPRATLARLTADVEAETRTLAAGAIAGAALEPVDLRPATVVAAGESLRRSAAAFDAQMTRVRELLIPAGQVAMGDGEPADRVALGVVGGVAGTADGTTWILVPEERRLLRVGADGILRQALGPADLAGATPTSLTPAGPSAVAVLAGARVLRVGADGAVATLWDAVPRAGAVLPGPDGAIWVLVQGQVTYKESAAELAEMRAAHAAGGDAYELTVTGATAPAALWELPAAGPVRKVRDFPADLTMTLDGLVPTAGRDAEGRLVLLLDGDPLGPEGGESFRVFPIGIANRYAWRLDPAAPTPELERASATFGLVAVMPTGEVAEVDGQLGFVLAGPDPRTISADPAFGEPGTDLAMARIGPDAFLVALNNGDGKLRRVEAGVAREIVGATAGASVGDDPNAIDLREVGGLAVLANGDLAVLLAAGGQVVRIGAGRALSVMSDFSADATFSSGYVGIQVPAARASLVDLLRASPTDQVAVHLRPPDEGSGTHQVHELAAGGGAAQLLDTFDVLDYQYVAGDEIVAIVAEMGVDGTYVLSRAKRDDGPAMDAGVSIPDAPQALVRDARTGELWVVGATKLWRYPKDVAVDPFDEDAPGPTPFARPAGLPHVAPGGAVMDAAGRLIVADRGGNRILRADLATGKVEVLAGPGGQIFTGTAVGDSLAGPAYPVFDPKGDLYFADLRHRQVKRIPASMLAGS